ncbi:SDR family NAD(P)-dependent oxidoreductase [Streptomyces sp. NPDC053079]|uniref:SDR family NAD(P)-dependent oxidoreductase n=1 Tax=Streptomyces sp. NPDC053079 TaxID=3365697 RepID=UPI0037D5CDD1
MSLLDVGPRVEGFAGELGGIAAVGSLTAPDDLVRLVDTTIEQYGRIDAVVNGAGHARNDALLEVTGQDWHDGLDMLLLSVVRMARLVTPHVLAAGKGRSGMDLGCPAYRGLRSAPCPVARQLVRP